MEKMDLPLQELQRKEQCGITEERDPFKFMPARVPGPTFDTKASWSHLPLFQHFHLRTLIVNKNANAVQRLQTERRLLGDHR